MSDEDKNDWSEDLSQAVSDKLRPDDQDMISTVQEEQSFVT